MKIYKYTHITATKATHAHFRYLGMNVKRFYLLLYPIALITLLLFKFPPLNTQPCLVDSDTVSRYILD